MLSDDATRYRVLKKVLQDRSCRSRLGGELPLGKPAPAPEVQAKELLRAVCPVPIVQGKEDYDKDEWGCATCPSDVIREWVGSWDLETVGYGHFTNATADEAVLAMSGCADHGSHWGATVLPERTDGHWLMRWFQHGLITSRCISIPRKDSRELPLCEARDTYQGLELLDLFVVDLGQRPAARRMSLLGLHQYMNTCGENVSQATTKIDAIQVAEYRRIAFDPAGARLTVEVEYGWRPYTVENAHACREAQVKEIPPRRPRAEDEDLQHRIRLQRREALFVALGSKHAKREVKAFHVNR